MKKMKKLEINPNNKRYYSDEYIKGWEDGVKAQYEATMDAVVDITQRDLCKDISCEDCPFLKGTCKLMDCVAYADRPHGEWIVNTDDSCGGITLTCSECGEQFNFDSADEVLDYKEYAYFCINCGADMRKEKE